MQEDESEIDLVTREATEHLRRKGLDEAIERCEWVLQREPRHFESHRLLGIAYGLKGDIDRARRHLDTALRLSPASPQIHFALGMLCQQGGKAAEAIHHMREALRLDPGYDKAQQELAGLLRPSPQPSHEAGSTRTSKLTFDHLRLPLSIVALGGIAGFTLLPPLRMPDVFLWLPISCGTVAIVLNVRSAQEGRLVHLWLAFAVFAGMYIPIVFWGPFLNPLLGTTPAAPLLLCCALHRDRWALITGCLLGLLLGAISLAGTAWLLAALIPALHEGEAWGLVFALMLIAIPVGANVGALVGIAVVLRRLRSIRG